MANLSSNTLFTLSALFFVVGLLLVVYPYLTLTAITLCIFGYTPYYYRLTLVEYYSLLSSKLCPVGNDNHVPYIANLFSGIDLPSPIPHVASLDTVKNRRSPVDEIISSTPRSTPTKHSFETHHPRSPLLVSTHESRQLNFARTSPKSSRVQPQDFHQNSVEVTSNQKLRNRSGNGKTVQTTAGPLLTSRLSPAFDAGIFVNVNSPGFTDRLVRCANDNPGIWGQGSLATRQEKYGSVGLFPIVHLNSTSPPSLTSKNSQKAPNSNVRVRIAAPAPSEFRHHHIRGNNIIMRPVAPTRELAKRNEASKSVLESLQEASRKRIYSQCQEVMDEDPGKKRQRKSDSAIPNPNCDMYQYRHIRAPPLPSPVVTGLQNDIHLQNKRLHDDPASRTNEPKRQCQYVKSHSSNNEISSSLSSSKTLLQRLNGSKRKADIDEVTEGSRGKHFKDSLNAVPASSNSRWLHSAPCDEGKSAARTQEVVRSPQKRSSDSNTLVLKSVPQKKNVSKENDGKTCVGETSTPTGDGVETSYSEKRETDLSAKLFRKDVSSRPHQRSNHSEKKGSSWTQEPPDADERCLLEQSGSSLDRPERFQSLLSRMSGPDTLRVKTVGASFPIISEEPSKSSSSAIIEHLNPKSLLNTTVSVSSSSTTKAAIDPNPNLGVSNSEMGNKTLLCTSSTSLFPPSQPSSFSVASVTSLSTNLYSVSPPSYTASVTREGTVTLKNQGNPDAASISLPPTVPSGIKTSSAAMFNFSPPASAPAVPPTVDAVTTFSTAIPRTCSVAQAPIVPPDKSIVSTMGNKASDVGTSLPVCTKTTDISMPSGGLAFSVTQPRTSSATFPMSTGSTASAVTLSKFSITGHSPQYATSQISFGSPLQDLYRKEASKTQTPTSNVNPVGSPASSSDYSASILNQTHTTASLAGPTNSFGGFKFSGSSKPLFDKSVSQGNGTEFSFTPVSASQANSTAHDISSKTSVGISTASDSKSAVGSGSITFGTVSTAIMSPPSNSAAFTFSPISSEKSATTEVTKVTSFQLSNFGPGSTNVNPTLSGYNNPSPQSLFNGFSSAANPTTLSSSFGTMTQPLNQSQNQQPSQGMFSFGSASSQQSTPSTAFGAATSTVSPIFGGAPQQPNFGAITTSGFPSQPAALSFSNAPFGTSTPSNNLPFGASQPVTAFGGQAGSNPPAFGVPLSSNPPTFGNTSTPGAPTFGASPTLSFGLSPLSEPAFGSNPSAATSAALTSAFSFGADKTAAPTGPTPAPTFSFGNTEQQPQISSQPFQFGQAANAGSSATFQFGSASTQQGGSGAPAFSMGSGPSTQPRSRPLQTRRRRL